MLKSALFLPIIKVKMAGAHSSSAIPVEWNQIRGSSLG